MDVVSSNNQVSCGVLNDDHWHKAVWIHGVMLFMPNFDPKFQRSQQKSGLFRPSNACFVFSGGGIFPHDVTWIYSVWHRQQLPPCYIQHHFALVSSHCKICHKILEYFFFFFFFQKGANASEYGPHVIVKDTDFKNLIWRSFLAVLSFCHGFFLQEIFFINGKSWKKNVWGGLKG